MSPQAKKQLERGQATVRDEIARMESWLERSSFQAGSAPRCAVVCDCRALVSRLRVRLYLELPPVVSPVGAVTLPVLELARKFRCECGEWFVPVVGVARRHGCPECQRLNRLAAAQRGFCGGEQGEELELFAGSEKT